MSDFNQTKYKNDYIKLSYDRVNLTMPKGKKETVKAAATASGMSLNEYINAAIDYFIENGPATNK